MRRELLENNAGRPISHGPHSIYDEASKTWVSEAEVAEVPLTAFTSQAKALRVTGRLILRRVPEKNKAKLAAGQETIFDVYRHHGFFVPPSMHRHSILLPLTGSTGPMR